MKDFRNLKVWEKARLTLAVYKASSGFLRQELFRVNQPDAEC
jgi:hypothetical protein